MHCRYKIQLKIDLTICLTTPASSTVVTPQIARKDAWISTMKHMRVVTCTICIGNWRKLEPLVPPWSLHRKKPTAIDPAEQAAEIKMTISGGFVGCVQKDIFNCPGRQILALFLKVIQCERSRNRNLNVPCLASVRAS